MKVDGGRMMTRAPEQSRGVHEQQWKEPKVGVLWRMTGQTFEEDPHPQLPRCFQDRERVEKLVREMHGGRTGSTDAPDHGITLEEIIATAGVPLKQIPDPDSRKIAHEALTYLQNNRSRMNYPEYRRQGMPVTSSLIESLIKEFNWRVKGTEKFWNRPEEPPTSRHTSRPVRGREHELPDMSGESILQVRAALLYDDDRLAQYLRSRPGSPYIRRRSRNAAACAD